MDPKRKRLYVILISACILISAAVFLWGRGGTPGTPSSSTLNPINSTLPTDTAVSAAPIINADGTYSAPPVFPESTKLDTSVLDSSAFKKLQAYQPATVSPGELGREDPFKNY